MRDVLNDALRHGDDGNAKVQAHARVQLPKRFYEQTGVAPAGGGYSVILDGTSPRTPGRLPVIVPTAKLAQAMAAEWAEQGERIDAATMPVVRLVNSALESGEEAVAGFVEEVLKFASHDLLLYRAETPRELVAEQERLWDPALTVLARHFRVKFEPTTGIVHQPQPKGTLQVLAGALDGAGPFEMSALASVTGLTGSGLLAIGLWADLMTPDDIWSAAHVDEVYNARVWGSDPEAVTRLDVRRTEFNAAVLVLRSLGEATI